jgi:microcystin degradation protein MlrC
MHRRAFLKSASITTLAAALPAVAMAAQPGAWPLFDKPPRVAFGGIRIECSTYSRILTRLDEFDILRGQEAADNDQFAMLKRFAFPFMPIMTANAVPGGPVERKAYETIKAEFLDRLKAMLPLDGVYLWMHGAMVVEGMFDAEGDWYQAIREVVGPDCLLAASYDLHGNISQRIIDNLDILSAYRTAPHVDRIETTMRAVDTLQHCLLNKIRPILAWVPVPVLMPGERSSTEWDPGRRLWSPLWELNHEPGILDVSMLVGYVWADEPRSTASVVVTGTSLDAEKKVATYLARKYWEARKEFDFGTETGTIDYCVKRAMEAKTQPAIIADSGDNPTGGGNGDQATVLEALLEAKAQGVVFAGITDKPATDACYAAGVGKTIALSIGGTLDPLASKPVKASATVLFLLDAPNPAKREAVVRIDGVTLVLAAWRRPYHDLIDFRRLGLEPKSFRIIVVKSGYLSPELKPIANPSLMALSDGAINQDIVNLPKNRYRRPSYPFVPDLAFTPEVYVSARSRT